MVVGLLLHALCAVQNCVPHNPAPAPASDVGLSGGAAFAQIGFRTGFGFDDFIDFDTSTKPLVTVPGLGSVEGTVMKTIKGRAIGAFMGIPYAQPPTGSLRFQPPVPIKPWNSVKVTNKTSSVCLQVDVAQYFNIVGREDCLYLNIYTPKLPKEGRNPKIPVIVYIHGGAYLFGSGSDLGPAYLLDNEVILVTINYRLGVLGFLSTGDEASPGNNGMKDQALALNFVRNHIAQFGGDVDRITFMGQSAGASSVNLHLMSPLSKHIPNAAIIHSGSAHQEWSIVNATVKNSKIIAQSFKCPTESKAMVDCLRRQNPYFVVFRTMKTFKKYFFPALPFGPIVEPDVPGAFLVQHPKDAYEQGNVRKVPIIGGIVENEGDLFTFEMVLYPGLLSALNRKFFQLAPYVLDYHKSIEDPYQLDSVTTQVKNYYFANNSINFYTRDRISKMLGDRWVVTGVHKALQYHSAVAPTYGYNFKYNGRYSVAHGLSLNRADWGVTHLDDIAYFLNSTFYFQPMKLEDPEYKISEFLTNVWSNFAATGKPFYTNIDGENQNFWKPITNPLDMKIIEITDKVKEVKFPFQDRIEFWKNLNLSDDYQFPQHLIPSSTTTTTTTEESIDLIFDEEVTTEISNDENSV